VGLDRDWGRVVTCFKERAQELEEKYIETVRSYIPLIEETREVIALLDIFTTFATIVVSAPIPYVRPIVLPRSTKSSGRIVLRRARHPLLEQQEGVVVVPNDLSLGKEKGQKSTLIITGPNMGGKSTYIRMVASIVHLAQIGMFVPCESAEISIVDGIHARVGATDYQTRGVSTFMAEMLETATMLNYGTESSLFVIDELGRGTSTYDGYGLAHAIVSYISSKIRPFCLFATHFHELTGLEDVSNNIANVHVTADTSTRSVVFRHEVRAGGCSRSFGIHVAELAGFPPVVLDVARQKAAELEGVTPLPEDKTCVEEETIPQNGRPWKKARVSNFTDGVKAVVMEFVNRFAKIDLTSSGAQIEIDEWKKDLEKQAMSDPALCAALEITKC